MIKAVIFDIGKTLISYNNPLNWSVLYKPALEHVAAECSYHLSDTQIQNAMDVLTKYNTRINPREYEVSSDTIFQEIITVWNTPTEDIEKVKECFYLFFRQESQPYQDAEITLCKLKEMNFLTGTLSDVAYGMDNKYVFEDIEPLKELIDYPFTSNDIGYRKPNIKGLEIIADKMGIPLTEIAYVGDEEKDIICANNAGACSILINRDKMKKEFGQQHEIHTMAELIDIIKSKNGNTYITIKTEEKKTIVK